MAELNFNKSKPSCMLRIWPDATIALVEDIRDGDYDHKSDDYEDVDAYNLPQHILDDEQLMAAIDEEMSGNCEEPTEFEMSTWLSKMENPEN